MQLGVRRIVLLALVGLVVVSASAVAWAWWHYRLPDLALSQRVSVRLFAGSEELMVADGDAPQAQIWVPLAEIPKPVVDAVLTAEDRRFFSHPGVDVLAVARAMLVNLRHGDRVQGGSTITQQLARTLYLSSARNWARKAREAWIALVLESRYGKAQILEAYLNTVYLGHDGDVAVHGVAAAARHFLSADLAHVRVDEAALLAGMIRAPNRIVNKPAQARSLRDGVIEAMREQGAISEVAAEDARRRPIAIRPLGARAIGRYFAPIAREEVDRRIDLPAHGEARVATTLDPVLQRAAEAAVRDGLARIEQTSKVARPGTLQAAVVAIEPGTGKIRVLVGGRRYGDSQFNRAVRAVRQPGSLFKPFVYLAAFEAERNGRAGGLTPASLLSDEPVVITARNGEDWSPKNLDGRSRGEVTVRQALVESLNVPAVRVAQGVGIGSVTRVAHGLGIQSRLQAVPSLALGTSEVNLLEITSAFAAIANGGVAVTPTALEPDAAAPALIPTRRLPDPVRAVSPESAFLVTYLMRGVMQQGTGASSARWGLSAVTAGKTGTTDALRDAWFVGYTPDLAIGVWVGHDDGQPVGLTGSQAALPIWAAVMQAAVKRVPPRPFRVPEGVVLASVEARTGRGISSLCGGGPAITEAFRAGTEPRVSCDAPAVVDVAAGKLVQWFRGLFH